MGWLIALGIIALLAVLPLGVSVRYDEDGAVVKVIAGPVKITLIPRPKKEKKPQKEKKPKEQPKKDEPVKQIPAAEQPAPKQTAPKPPVPEKLPEEPLTIAPVKQPEPQTAEKQPVQEPPAEPKKKGGSLMDFLPLVKIALDFLGDFRRKLRVNVLELKLILGGGDPCDLAVNYGKAWAALGNLLPRLERFLVIQKRDINIECDFTAGATTVIARMDLTITLGRLLAAAVVFAVRALVEFLKIMNKRKGGASNEPKSS